MSIAPSDFSESAATQLWPLPADRRPLSQPGVDAPPEISAPTDPVSGSGNRHSGASEMSLTRLIAQLSRQLKALEQTFMRALTSLARSVESSATSTVQGVQSENASRPKGANPYDGLIRRSAQHHEIDPALLEAVVRAESGFDPRAVSSAGAMGLMQLMPETAKSLGVRDPYDPSQNVEAGATLLRSLIDRYSGRLDLALAAYNAGPGAVDKFHGVPPYAETRGYVNSILADYRSSALGA